MATNVNDLYEDMLYLLRVAPMETTRGGMVRTIQRPVIATVDKPMERVLFNPERMANPYFHIMEAVWMLGGYNEAHWLEQFNSNIMEYAEPDGRINGAYGHRWRNHWHYDQIAGIIKMLERDPDTRQAVMVMYDPQVDPEPHWKDRPCNTHIYFRRVECRLDMTVCNRSNDVVWGMCGANIVHMTILHELVASALAMPIGRYHVMTNNLHIYQRHWEYMKSPKSYDHYGEGVKPTPLLTPKEDYYELLNECEQFVKNNGNYPCHNTWLRHTVTPMFEHYQERLMGNYTSDLDNIEATDWRKACVLWAAWHNGITA